MTGIEMIIKERDEQINKHGRTVIKDVANNSNNELLDGIVHLSGRVQGLGFPRNWDKELCEKMDGKPMIEKLAIMGAWCAAEIDRRKMIES